MSETGSALAQHPPGVWRWDDAPPAEQVRSEAEAAGWRAYLVDGSAVRDKAGWLSACAAALAFPDWFGHNWDALTDCLTDLSWLPDTRRVVIIDDVDTFATADRESWAVALGCFRQAATWWADTPTPLQVLILGGGSQQGPSDHSSRWASA